MGLIYLIIYSFFVEKHKLQFPQLMVLEFCDSQLWCYHPLQG